MRLPLFLSFATTVLSSLPPDHGTMVNFISCECIDNLEEIHTELPPIVAPAVLELFEWYSLDEATFIELARKPAEHAHRAAMRRPIYASMLQSNMEPLRRTGMSPEEVTTALLKKYYIQLHGKTELIAMERQRKRNA